MKEQLDFKLKNVFAKPVIFAGYLFIAVAMYCFYKDALFIGLFILMICGHLSFSYTGVEIDFKKNMYKTYVCYFGLKLGSWSSLKNYKYISILSRNYSQGLNSIGEHDILIQTILYELCLLNESHRSKVVLSLTDSLENTELKAVELSDKLGFEIVEYSPVLSEQNKLRRQKRMNR